MPVSYVLRECGRFDSNGDINGICSYPLGITRGYACCIAGNTTSSGTLHCMPSAEQFSTLPFQPTTFSQDSDEQLLLWMQHAQTMREVEGRWQGAWSMLAAAAEQECARRNLSDCVHLKRVS